MADTEGDKRIVFVSSMMHSVGVWDPNNLQGETSYGRIKFYGNSKLYNVSNGDIVSQCGYGCVVFLTDYDNVCTTKES